MKFRVMLMGLFFMPMVAVAIFGFTNAFDTHQLKPVGKVTEFELVAHTGEKVTEETLRGKVWIASFIFTHCDTQCPRIMSAMKQLQKSLYTKSSVRLISLSVDPKRDTIQALAEYAERVGAKDRWLFLTGEEDEVKRLTEKEFKLSAVEDPTAAMPSAVIHSSYLALVDGEGVIRGYYDAMDETRVSALISDAKGLVRGLAR